MVYHCSSWGLLRALWFGSVATHVLWFTYAKAVWNTGLWAAGLKSKGRFKTTIKTGVLAGTPRGAGPGACFTLDGVVPIEARLRLSKTWSSKSAMHAK